MGAERRGALSIRTVSLTSKLKRVCCDMGGKLPCPFWQREDGLCSPTGTSDFYFDTSKFSSAFILRVFLKANSYIGGGGGRVKSNCQDFSGLLLFLPSGTCFAQSPEPLLVSAAHVDLLFLCFSSIHLSSSLHTSSSSFLMF